MKPRGDSKPRLTIPKWENGGTGKPIVISDRKDVAITINAAGIKANGEQRYCRVIRFYGGAEKKICGDSLYLDCGVCEGRV